MLVCALATVVPLLLGYRDGNLTIAIYASLAGFLMGLSDAVAPVGHRLLIATVAFATACSGFAVGISLQASWVAFTTVAMALTYGLGLMGGRGGEFERLILFGILELVLARYSPALAAAPVPTLALYMLAAYVTALLSILLTAVTLQKAPGPFVHIRYASRQPFTRDPKRHIYALQYLCAVGLTVLCIETLRVPRGYWSIITVLLIMRPDRKEALYRITQRMFGTLLGVAVGELVIYLHLPLAALMGGAALCGLGVPYAWRRNYWWVSFGATNLVILLLSIAQYGHLDGAITWMRLQATLLGCGIGLFVVLVFGVGAK